MIAVAALRMLPPSKLKDTPSGSTMVMLPSQDPGHVSSWTSTASITSGGGSLIVKLTAAGQPFASVMSTV
jgi:hypothetical protein